MRVQSDAKTVVDLKRSLDLLQGRLNAVTAVLITLARTLPRADASLVSGLLTGASERIAAHSLATTLPDLVLSEQERVLKEFVALVNQAASEG